VQRLLGHRGLETTEIYTHVEVEDLRHVVEQAAKS
jgi:site-specific recombinase XerD